MGELLKKVNSPADLKTMSIDSLNTLSGEIREFLIDKISVTGGHLASNLGVVELTIALHRSFDLPKDKIVWDVGHQAYVHKILTGRKDKFDNIRKKGGISGFPKTSESEYDAFDTGHSGTSLSVALGLAVAGDLAESKNEVIAVVGDASFGSGMSFEALNHISHSGKKVIIVLNDNQMSIGKATGSLSKYLNKIRTNEKYYSLKRETKEFFDKIPLVGKPVAKTLKKIKGHLKYAITPGVVFEQLGYKYFGPVDGHNIERLCKTFEEAKRISCACVVHITTVKGKGYAKAEQRPTEYHAISGNKKKTADITFSNAFGQTMMKIAQSEQKLVAISPAMASSSGLGEFMNSYPQRFFDTGIAEEHAATFAAGIEAGGRIPVLAIYSTFLQRAYDSLVHDIALCNRHVVLAIDRAGVVGEDGETHQGVFDLSFMMHIPNVSILAPSDTDELRQMIEYAVLEHKGPIAVRYPRGSAPVIEHKDFEFGKSEILKSGENVTILAVGKMVHTALETAEILSTQGISAEVINVRTVKPFDKETITMSAKKTGLVVTIEDNLICGGFGSTLATYFAQNRICVPVIIKGFPQEFITHASVSEIMMDYKMDAKSVAEEVKKAYENKA